MKGIIKRLQLYILLIFFVIALPSCAPKDPMAVAQTDLERKATHIIEQGAILDQELFRVEKSKATVNFKNKPWKGKITFSFCHLYNKSVALRENFNIMFFYQEPQKRWVVSDIQVEKSDSDGNHQPWKSVRHDKKTCTMISSLAGLGVIDE